MTSTKLVVFFIPIIGFFSLFVKSVRRNMDPWPPAPQCWYFGWATAILGEENMLLMLLALLLCVGYFATPIRPEIARFTANRYPQYAFPPTEIVSTGYRQFYWFEWVTDYGAQALNNPYFAYIELNGFLPFPVQASELWQLKDSGDILIAP